MLYVHRMKPLTQILVALVIGSSLGVALAAVGVPTASTAPEHVSKITPFHACEVTYINNPRRHWCDRKGHVHWQ